jgi:hypothetical protein
MASKTIRIWEGVDQSKTKDMWGSQSIANINNIIKSNISGDYRITSATLNVYADFDGAGGLANVYMKYGFGSTNSISTQLGGERKLTKDSTNYPNDITSYLSSDKKGISTSYGSYFVANVYTANVVVGSSGALHISYVELVVNYDLYYTATFKNYDGTTLQSISVKGGSTPSYTGSTPTKPATAQYTYTFSGWSPSLGNITTATTYTAQFTATKRKYTLTVKAGTGGTVSGGGSYEYGTKPTLTATPNAGYKFVKWSDGVTTASRTVTVTGAATYTATFEKLPPEFTAVSMTYLNKQISSSNKVTTGAGYIISVGVK